MARGFSRVFERLHRAPSGPTDGQLLGRFVASRDEAAFAELVRRHGPMVLGVCRRVLGHEADAEDAFQATFLVLARKAGSVVRRESVGCWLHGVARRTALRAGAALARRRTRERSLDGAPEPASGPAEAQDWRDALDRELGRLPAKFRAAVVACELEGRPRREAARLLGVPEGTLSSRLAAARALLGRRLAARGVTLPAGGVAAGVLAEAVVRSTARAAAVPGAESLAAAALMREVTGAMLMRKRILVFGAALLAAAVGSAGLGQRPSGGSAAVASQGRPLSEVEALRRENELLKLNLEVVLEKVRAQEAELRGLRGGGGPTAGMGAGGPGMPAMGMLSGFPGAPAPGSAAGTPESRPAPGNGGPGMGPPLPAPGTGRGGMGPGPLPPPANRYPSTPGAGGPGDADPLGEAEAALRRLREAGSDADRQTAAEALDRALKRLREPAGRAPSKP
jgi:RNA polymerase sigma factor (sigma-70 family)